MMKMAVGKWLVKIGKSLFKNKQRERPISTNCISKLQEAIEVLNDNQYHALIMYFEGYSHQEIGQQLKISVKDVKQHIFCGSNYLKFHLLAKYDFTLSNRDRFTEVHSPRTHQLQ